MTLTSSSESSEVKDNYYPEIVCENKTLSLTDSPKSPRKQVKKPHQCDFDGCSATFSRPWRLQAHRAVHLGKRPFPCNFENCDKSYTSNYHLRRHRILSHSTQPVDTKLIKCRHPECSKEFKTKQIEKKHFMRSHQQKTCQECGKSFFKHSQLEKHILSHSGHLPYACDECNMGFEHLFLLNRHQRSHLLHLCPIKTCMKAFENWSSVRKHLRSHPYDFVCIYCKKGYRQKRFLQEHIIRHGYGMKRKQCELKKYPCEICNNVISGKASLKRHMKKVHEKPPEPVIEEANSKPTTSKPRLPRWDKGIPKKSFASVLSKLEVPKEVNASIIHEIPRESIFKS